MGVLLVEDERLLERVVADALRTVGLTCETAHSIEDALKHLQTRRYELMILDLRLHQGSGVTVLRQARQLYPMLPVILVTAYAATDEVQDALALGVDALLYKPYDIDTLLATVRALLRQQRVERIPDRAVVQMSASSAPTEARCIRGLETGTLTFLKSVAVSLAARVRAMDEQGLSVEPERLEPPNTTRWQLEWT
ncbi:MAG: response regulator, partial [Fimbriimonadales bacterium]|nr:response regulator [Fimbriimonadales bacterium]